MATKRYTQRKSSVVAKFLLVASVSLLLAAFIGFGMASAGGAASSEASFGLSDQAIQNVGAEKPTAMTEVDDVTANTASLTTVSKRDISVNVAAIDAQLEAERKAAEELARAEEAKRIAAAEQAKAAQEQAAAAEGAQSALASLSDVDWSCGEAAFVAEWTARIDAYLAGSPLAGYGSVFAQAAWNNGVDPRFSPAISNTESSKGAHCFQPYNAWGWGSSGWSSWEEAINAHVAGLASGYGYSITYAAAQKYCPPNTAHWFNNTLNQMKLI